MDLDFEKYCKVDESPRTVLQSSHHQSKHENKSRKSKSSSRKSQASLEAGFKEIKFRNYHRSFSCKTLPTKNSELAVDREVLKRGSVYQCSNDRKPFKRPDDVGGRKKIELSLSGNSPFSFSLLDSICGSDEEQEQQQRPSSSTNAPRPDQSSRNSNHVKFVNRESSSSKPAERDFMEDSKFKSHEVVGPSSTGNILKEDDNQFLRKSLSSKLALPHSPTHSGSEVSKSSSVSRFTPIRKMLDPLTKSKSHKTVNSKLENSVVKSPLRLTSIEKSKTLQKSLLSDFSSAIPKLEKDHEHIVSPSSANHLHGDVKLENKHGISYFELSLAHSDDVLVAKTWKTEDALNWFYTFHSVPNRKKSNASGWGVKYSNKDSPIVGQMQVSCHLCSELKGGPYANSMMTEFVLYDILRTTKGSSAEESVVVEPHASSDGLITPIKLKHQAANAFENCNLDLLVPCAVKDLHPSHEIAAMVIKVPFEKRESLKHRSGDDTFIRQPHSDLHDLSLPEPTSKGNRTNTSASTTVCVVTPFGNHSLPSCDIRGPSPLLDRWRLGGCCDCGGWDMACPLNVLENLRPKCKEENHLLLQGDQPFSLHFQGAKEKSPALTMKMSKKGQYWVHFHEQMSALQVLAICVAILHTTEEDSMEQEKHRQLLQCSSSMEVFIEEKVKLLIETVTEEEKDKVITADEPHPSSFGLNPPFSPIARV